MFLQDNASSEEHVLYVWDHFVSRAEAKNVFIMAHSYGGLSFVELVSLFCFLLFLSLSSVFFHATERSGEFSALPSLKPKPADILCLRSMYWCVKSFNLACTRGSRQEKQHVVTLGTLIKGIKVFSFCKLLATSLTLGICPLCRRWRDECTICCRPRRCPWLLRCTVEGLKNYGSKVDLTELTVLVGGWKTKFTKPLGITAAPFS